MGNTISSFFESPAITLLFNVISNYLETYGIMASPSNFKISPGMTSGPTDFFFPIADNRFLITLIVKVKGLPDYVD